VTVGSWSYLAVNQPQKIAIPHSMEARRFKIQTSKFYFFWAFFTMNFFTPKLMKIRWFFFFWIFWILLPNQVEHILLKSQLHICNYEWARILFVNEGLDSKLQHCGKFLGKFLGKKSKTSHLDRKGHIKCDIMQNHEQKKELKTKIIWTKQTSLLAPYFLAHGQF
jgi:hypothetical protein